MKLDWNNYEEIERIYLVYSVVAWFRVQVDAVQRSDGQCWSIQTASCWRLRTVCAENGKRCWIAREFARENGESNGRLWWEGFSDSWTNCLRFPRALSKRIQMKRRPLIDTTNLWNCNFNPYDKWYLDSHPECNTYHLSLTIDTINWLGNIENFPRTKAFIKVTSKWTSTLNQLRLMTFIDGIIAVLE